MRCALLGVLVCMLAACSGDATSIAEDDYCTAIAEAQCDGAFRCCPTVGQRFVTVAECVSAHQSGCENTVLYARLGRGGIPLDGVAYDAAEGARVVSEFRDAATSCDTPPDTFWNPGLGGASPTNPIPRPYRGALDRGAACVEDKECAGELVCRPAVGDRQARHCLPEGAVGDACLAREHCVDGSYCPRSGGICIALRNDGDACLVGDWSCAPGLICSSLESPDDAHCTPLSSAGEPCFVECADSSLCEASCAPGTFCSRPRGAAPVCAPRGNIGDLCTTSDRQECQSGFCDRTTSTCAACTEHAQCGALSVCRSGVCIFEPGAPELRSHCPVIVGPLP